MAKDKKEEASLAGRAWNATKEENDPDWASIPNTEFKSKLEFAAERVKETGTAKTNFEVAVFEFAAEDAKAAGPVNPPVHPDAKGMAAAAKAAAKASTAKKAKSKAVAAKKKANEVAPVK